MKGKGPSPFTLHPTPLFRQVTIIGLGLMGGSLGMVLRKRRLARRVIGFSRREATVERAKARGAVDDGCTELCPDWLGDSELVVIATPPEAVATTARAVARLTRHRFVLTDVASAKAGIVSKLERILPERISFVGGHPMAGSDLSGIEAADPALFDGAVCILTPTSRTRRQALSRVSSLWREVGGRPVSLSPSRHDLFVAQVSHVPHLAAAGLLLAADSPALRFAAGGLADATRIALSDPALWVEICRMNRRQLKTALDRFIRTMEQLRASVSKGDKGALLRRLQAARRARRGLLK